MGLISFIFYNLSNVLLIIFLPLNDAKEFLNYYSLGSGIFSFLVFYNFAKKKFLNASIIILLCIIFLTISFKFNLFQILVFVYVFLLLFSDYFFSQSNLIKINLFFKIGLLISSLLLYFEFSLYFILQIKIFIVLFFLLLSYFFNIHFKILKVNSPVKYSAYTCIVYFGALFLTSILAEKETVKVFYICLQIFLGLKLKIFDLKVREIKYQYINFDKIFNYLSIIFFLILSLYFKEFIYFVIYLVSNFALENVKKKYIF